MTEESSREIPNTGESCFKTLLESAVELIEALDANGLIVYATPSSYRWLGYRPDELSGRSSLELVHPEDQSAWKAALAGAIQNRGRSMTPVSIRMRHRDGSWHTMGRTIQALSEPCGKTVFTVSSRDVGECHEPYEALRESETLFRSLTEGPVAGICVVQNGVFKYANPRFAELFGYALGELTGKNWEDLVVSDDIPLVHENILGLETGRLDDVHYEFRGIGKNKEIIQIELYGNRTSYGGQPAVIGTLLDVSRRKTLEQAFLESEDKFRVLAEKSLVGIYAIQEGIITYANPRLAEIYGYEVDEITGMPWEKVIYPEDIPIVHENIRRRVSGEIDAIHYEFRGLKKNGEVIWADVYGSRMLVQGKPAAIGTQLDISERKRLEAALLESENKFKGLSEKSLVGIYLIQDGVFKYVNPKFAEIHGYEAEEMMGTSWEKHVYPEDHAIVEENIRKRMVGEVDTINYQFRACKKDGTIVHTEVYGRVTQHQGKPALIGTALDITDRKRWEEDLARQAAELARSNADLEHFAYIASHDLQEPLRMVASFADLLARRYKGRMESDADEFIEFIVSGANRMRQLIEDLLAYSRVGTQAKSRIPADCQAAFDQAVRNLALTIDEHHATVQAASLPVVIADAGQLSQVFQNLIANAIKFHGSEPPRVDVAAIQVDEEWVFSVRDNGIGIDPRHFDRIFAVFQRLHSQQEYPGTGIGLALCKKIVERHGGRIWVESQPGRGACFHFTLPTQPDETQWKR